MKRGRSLNSAAIFPIVFFVVFAGFPQHSHARNLVERRGYSLQSGNAQPQWETGDRSIWSDITTSVGCVGHVITSPLRWDGGDWTNAGVTTAGVAGSFLLDDEVRSLVARNHTTFSDNVADVGNTYASFQYVGPPAVVLYFSGAALHNKWMRDTGQMLIEAVVTTGAIEVPVGITVGRARPLLNEGSSAFKLFGGTNSNRASFFSGHSMIAFSFSTILSHQINNPWATAGLYALAVLGPYARVYKDKHWFSDTALGAVLGIAVGNSIWQFHHGPATEHCSLSIAPINGGLSLIWQF
jgi:membrane-associated phospholipid phosphatase